MRAVGRRQVGPRPRRARLAGAIAAIITSTDAAPGDRVDVDGPWASGGRHTRSLRFARMGAAPCLPVPPGLVTCRAVLGYDDEVREAVIGLKNRGERALVAAAGRRPGRARARRAGPPRHLGPDGPRRRRQRGFDQAELLARAVARRRRLPVRTAAPAAPRRRPSPGAPPASDGATPVHRPRTLATGRCCSWTTWPPPVPRSRRPPPPSAPPGCRRCTGWSSPGLQPEHPRRDRCSVRRHHATREACPWRSP